MNRWKTGLFAVLLLGLGVFLALGQNSPADPGAPGGVRITAKKYEFEPSVIKVPKGSHVRLIVTPWTTSTASGWRRSTSTRSCPRANRSPSNSTPVNPGPLLLHAPTSVGLATRR
jgi:hypothetical protein